MADGGPVSSRGLLSLIIGTISPHDVALRFLSSEQYDEELLKKDALPELAALLQSEFELAAQAGEDPKDLRGRLARHILTTDFLNALQGSLPQQLTSLKIAAEPASSKACIDLARIWRSRRDLRNSYVAASNQVFVDLGLSKILFNLDQILNVETFLETEQALQSMVEDALAKETRLDLVQMAEKHQSGFWSEQPMVQARWSSISVAGQVLLEADRVEKELRLCPESAKSIFEAYISGDRPWLLLDSSYRNMEKRFHYLDQEIGDNLELLIIRARQRYMAATIKDAGVLPALFSARWLPNPRSPPPNGNIRKTDQTNSTGGQDRLYLGRCLEVRDGQGTASGPKFGISGRAETRHSVCTYHN